VKLNEWIFASPPLLSALLSVLTLRLHPSSSLLSLQEQEQERGEERGDQRAQLHPHPHLHLQLQRLYVAKRLTCQMVSSRPLQLQLVCGVYVYDMYTYV